MLLVTVSWTPSLNWSINDVCSSSLTRVVLDRRDVYCCHSNTSLDDYRSLEVPIHLVGYAGFQLYAYFLYGLQPQLTDLQ